MKLKNVISVVTFIVLLASSSAIVAQADSIGKKYYAYAHFYSEDMNTEYISSVFCWIYNPPKNSNTYPNDFLTAWAKSNLKNILPKIKAKDCTCRFEIDGTTNYYSADNAIRLWNLEMSECTNQGIDVEIVNFPPCIDK